MVLRKQEEGKQVVQDGNLLIHIAKLSVCTNRILKIF